MIIASRLLTFSREVQKSTNVEIDKVAFAGRRHGPHYPTKVRDQLIFCGDSNRQSKVALEFGFAMIAKSKYLAIAELKVKN